MSYNEWLDIDVLEDYLDGKLDAKAMHQIERLSLEDPFVAEALAGLSQSPKRTQSLSLLQKQLQDRIAAKPIEQKRWRITSQRLSIAATAAVLFVTVSLLFWMRENSRQEALAKQAKNIDVNIAADAKTATPTKENPQNKAEIDAALADAKTNAYANVSKAKSRAKETIQPVKAATMGIADEPVQHKEIAAAKREVSLNNNAAIASIQAPKSLKAKIVAKSRVGTISGKVSDENGEPLVGAAVTVKGSDLVARTDANGEFKLSMDSLLMKQKLAVNYIGFVAKEVAINKKEPLNISLTEDKSTLSEIVVSGYSKDNVMAKRTAVASSAAVISPNTTPVDGWEKLELYFKANNKLLLNETLTGKGVELSFTVRKNGRPDNISIVKSLTKAENDEAVRLLKNGPDWTVPKDTTTLNFITIKF